jgi:hypothetical protein
MRGGEGESLCAEKEREREDGSARECKRDSVTMRARERTDGERKKERKREREREREREKSKEEHTRLRGGTTTGEEHGGGSDHRR